MTKTLALLSISPLLLAAYCLFTDRIEYGEDKTVSVGHRPSLSATTPVSGRQQQDAIKNFPRRDNHDFRLNSMPLKEAYFDRLKWEYPEVLEGGELVYADVFLLIGPMLSHVKPEARLQAVTLLGEYRHHGINYDIVHALEDPDPIVRIAVIEALSMQRDEFMVFYIEPALYDQDQTVRLAAIRAIAEGENEQSVYALSGLLSDRDADIRLNAVSALGEIGGEASIYYLKQKLYDSDRRIRRNAEAILDELDAVY